MGKFQSGFLKKHIAVPGCILLPENKWVIFGYFGGTKNGTSGARIKILRPGSKCSTLTYLLSGNKMQPGNIMCFLRKPLWNFPIDMWTALLDISLTWLHLCFQVRRSKNWYGGYCGSGGPGVFGLAGGPVESCLAGLVGLVGLITECLIIGIKNTLLNQIVVSSISYFNFSNSSK